jgi:hypothetical protein
VAEDQRRQQPQGDREQRRQQVGGTQRHQPLLIRGCDRSPGPRRRIDCSTDA